MFPTRLLYSTEGMIITSQELKINNGRMSIEFVERANSH